MPYTTPVELIGLYGEDQLSLLADRTGDFVADHDVIERAIRRADAEIDSHIGARYPLPLPGVPDILVQISGDIAVYRLATDGGALTDEHRQRYEDAVALLKRISDGKAVLSFPNAGSEEETSDDQASEGSPSIHSNGPRPIVAGGEPRLFSREKLRGH